MRYIVYILRKLIGQHVPKPTDKFKTFVFEGFLMGDGYTYCALTTTIDDDRIPNPDKIKETRSRVIVWHKKPLPYYHGKKLPVFTEETPQKGMFKDIAQHYLIPDKVEKAA